MTTFVYKIMTREDWDAAERAGKFMGSADDLRDGFIHFSAADQIAATLEKHFPDQNHLILVKFSADDLWPDLKWEVSRGGTEFPHLYTTLDTQLAISVTAIEYDPATGHRVPALTGQ